MKKGESQVIQDILITPYSLSYTNKKGVKVSKKLVAFIGGNSKAILPTFRDEMAAKRAIFSGYIDPALTGAPADAKKHASTWESPKTHKKFTTCKGWLVDPQSAPGVIAQITPSVIKAFQADEADKQARKAEKQALKADEKSKSGRAVKHTPVKTASADASGAVALVASAVKKYGDFKKIPAPALTSLNNICEASGTTLKDARALADLI
jgi:hypothetical protein